jgi:hypothetical protein
MPEVLDFPAGGYRFIRGSMAYSLGVAALPGYRLERVRFQSLLPLEDAFPRIADVLAGAQRPASALASLELRSPTQFTEAGFGTFNARYTALLRDFGWSEVGGANPVSRTNVCPSHPSPPDVAIYAFSYTVADTGTRPSFVLAGAVDLRPGDKDLRELIVAPGQVDLAGIRSKAAHALDELEARLSQLGFDWAMTTGNGLYCVHDIFEVLTGEITGRRAAPAGITWHLCRPPIGGLEFEMDTRAVSVDRTI